MVWLYSPNLWDAFLVSILDGIKNYPPRFPMFPEPSPVSDLTFCKYMKSQNRTTEHLATEKHSILHYEQLIQEFSIYQHKSIAH